MLADNQASSPVHRFPSGGESGKFGKVIVLINGSFPLELDWLKDPQYGVDACLWIGNVGMSGITAVAKALVGEVNPSGRLTDTYVKDNFSSPAAASWRLQNGAGTFAGTYDKRELLSSETQTRYGVYTEGIYVGYRYYETRYEDAVLGREGVGDFTYEGVVSRPFGYGLSYTTFAYRDYTITETADGFEVAVTVTNTGAVPGKEVVQVYLQKPYTDYDIETGVEKAAVELAGFAKTDALAPGESETVTVFVERESFKTYDAYGYGTYILEPGPYCLALGSSAHDALNNILAAKGYTPADGMDRDGDPALAILVGEDIELDTTTYAVSGETGAAITNRLGFADINEYEEIGRASCRERV